MSRYIPNIMQGAPLEGFGGNATNLEDKFLSYKDDNSMSA